MVLVTIYWYWESVGVKKELNTAYNKDIFLERDLYLN